MSKKDELTEMLVGKEGAIRCVGKFYIMPTANKAADMPLTLVSGVVVCPSIPKIVSPQSERTSEMWEGEIILIPKRKHSAVTKGDKNDRPAYNGWTLGQVLTNDFGNPENWGDCLYDDGTIPDAKEANPK